MDTEKQIQDLEMRLKKIEDILFGINDDPRFKAKVRTMVFDDKEHTADKPTIVNRNGKKYDLQIV